MRHNLIARLYRNESDSAGTSAPTVSVLNKVIAVSFNAQYEKDEKGNTKIVKVPGPDNTVVEQKVVKKPARTINANVTAPRFEDLTPDILISLYNDRLEKLATAAVKSEQADKLINGASFDYNFSVADLLNVTVDIPDELVEKAQNAFMEYLAKLGKTDKAQKNNAAFLVMSAKKIQMNNPDFVNAYAGNLNKFVENSAPELLQEIEAVITRAVKNLDDAKNASTDGLI